MHSNLEIMTAQLRGILGLKPHACCADIVAKVRETKSAADLAGEALQIQRDSSMAISPETFADWSEFDSQELHGTMLTLFPDGSGTLFTASGEMIVEFDTPSGFAAFFDASSTDH